MTKISTNAPAEAAEDWVRAVGCGGTLRLTSLSTPEFDQLPDPKLWLSPHLINEYLLLKHEVRRREWLITRWMLLQSLRLKRLDVYREDSTCLHMERGGNGQPLLPRIYGWGVSLSHCQGYAAVILAPGHAGIDVERYRPQVHRMADRYLQPAEKLVLGEDTGGLTLGWAVKEAVFKWMGGGGIAFRDAICVESIHPEQGILRVRVQQSGEPEGVVIGVHYDQQPALERVCAWVVEGKGD